MSEPTNHPLESLLSEFSLGPAWARPKSDKSSKPEIEREHAPRRREYREDRGDFRSREQGASRDFSKSGQKPRDGRRGAPERPREDRGFRQEFIAPAEGVKVTISPDRKALQLIYKEVQSVARVYSLFDIAETIISSRARCRAIFEIKEKSEPFLQCKKEEALFLTKEEAIRFILNATWKDQYIEEAQVQVAPPKGSFQSIARCGLSGKILGPPNYHAYQNEIRRIHRENYADMPFEIYVSKIRTERSEELVNAWLEAMTQQTRWRIRSKEEWGNPLVVNKPSEEVPELTEDTVELAPSEEAAQEEPPLADSEESVEEVLSESLELDEAPILEEVAPKDDYHWFTSQADLERALSTELLAQLFKTTRKANLSADTPAKNLSPGLLVRLKAVGAHHRKHPAILIPDICKMFDQDHVPVFKRQGKIFTGPARPNALPLDTVLAERPGIMVTWIRENSPAKLEGLWQAVLPEGATAPPQEYAADLFWLLQQGHILLYTDDTLVVQDPPKPPEPKKAKKKKASTAASESTGEAMSEEIEPANEEIGAVEESPEVVFQPSEELETKAPSVEAVNEDQPETITE